MNNRISASSSGATLIEVLLVMAIVGMFVRLITLNVFRGQQRVSLTVARDTLLSDMRKQQLRAMLGQTPQSGSLLDYSIRFEGDRYILYAGTVYDAQNPENEVVILDPILTFEPIELPNATLTFARASGEVRSFDPLLHYVTIRNTQTDNNFRIEINALGVPSIP